MRAVAIGRALAQTLLAGVLAWLTVAAFAVAAEPLPMPHPLDTPIPSNEISTLQATINACPGAGPCLIQLAAGVYTGNFNVTGKTNVTIESASGVASDVVITSRDARFLVPNSLFTSIGGGVYTIGETFSSTIFRTDGRKVLLANDLTHFNQLVAAGIQVALSAATSRIYLEGANPNTTPLFISNTTNGATITCVNSPGLTIRKVSVYFGGAQGINLDDAAPCNTFTLDEVTVLGGKDAIRCKGGTQSATIVRRSWLVSSNDDRWYYRDVKGNSNMEGSAIACGGTTITHEENILQGWFNGIGFGPTGAATSANPTVQRNLMVDLDDDAIEADGKVDIGTGAGVLENRLEDGFVCLSFAPRQFNAGVTFPISLNTMQCIKAPLEDRNVPGSQFFGQGTKFNSHPPGTAAQWLTLTFNTIWSFNDTFRYAPASNDTWSSNIVATDNIIVGMFGPLVRMTGDANPGNSFQRNHYWLVNQPGDFSRGWAVDCCTQPTYATLALAKAGPEVTAAGWETTGSEGDPSFLLTSTPSSLNAGSPATGRGAWLGGAFTITATTNLATGWILRRGTGFTSNGNNGALGMMNPWVVSSTTAFARRLMGSTPRPTWGASKSSTRSATPITQ